MSLLEEEQRARKATETNSLNGWFREFIIRRICIYLQKFCNKPCRLLQFPVAQFPAREDRIFCVLQLPSEQFPVRQERISCVLQLPSAQFPVRHSRRFCGLVQSVPIQSKQESPMQIPDGAEEFSLVSGTVTVVSGTISGDVISV